jgi:integrase
MSKGRREGHIRRRSSGSYEIRVTLPADASGKQRVRTETVRGALRDAQRRLREILADLDKGASADPGKLTVGQWLEQWLAECKHTVAPKTWQERAAYVRLHLVPALGSIRIAKLSTDDIQQYVARALTAGRLDGKGGLAPQTVAHHEWVLHAALERARRRRMIAVNPCDDVERPRVERAPIVTLNAEQQLALLKAVRDTDLYVLAFLALATGLRRGELLGLAWPNIDLDSGLLRVVQVIEETNNPNAEAGQPRTVARIKPSPKTQKGRRTVALTPGTVAVLRAYRIEQAEDRLRRGTDLLFPHWADSPAVFGTALTRAAARAGLECSIHDLRHTHITDLLAAGVHPKIVSERVGHSSVAFTLQRYGHVTPTLNVAAIQAIGAALPALRS